jgi:hypothetical protein
MVIQNTDGSSKSSKATEVERERKHTTSDSGPTEKTVGGQDVDTGRKPEDKQNAADQWRGDDVRNPEPSDSR